MTDHTSPTIGHHSPNTVIPHVSAFVSTMPTALPCAALYGLGTAPARPRPHRGPKPGRQTNNKYTPLILVLTPGGLSSASLNGSHQKKGTLPQNPPHFSGSHPAKGGRLKIKSQIRFAFKRMRELDSAFKATIGPAQITSYPAAVTGCPVAVESVAVNENTVGQQTTKTGDSTNGISKDHHCGLVPAQLLTSGIPAQEQTEILSGN